jgi:hypothetical protein
MTRDLGIVKYLKRPSFSIVNPRRARPRRGERRNHWLHCQAPPSNFPADNQTFRQWDEMSSSGSQTLAGLTKMVKSALFA